MSTETLQPQLSEVTPVLTPASLNAVRSVIEPPSGWSPLDLRTLWAYRGLMYYLTWRDIKVRYRQAVLGAGWAIIQPVVTMVIFTLIFSRVAHLPSGGVAYPVFTFVALLPWTYFAYVVTQGGQSLVANGSMISKVYFPRLAFVVSVGLAGLADLAMSSLVLAVLMAFFRVPVDGRMLFAPIFLGMAIAVSLGVTVWLAALNVKYRDVKYVIPFLVQVWMYASPVAYSASLIKGKLAVVYAVNPMAAVIQGFRWSLLGVGRAPDIHSLPALLITCVILVSGLFYFRRVEQTFADML